MYRVINKYLSGGIVGIDITGAAERFLAKTLLALFNFSPGDCRPRFSAK